ncbi:SRSO17 transposase [Brassicibacter mesophilus]
MVLKGYNGKVSDVEQLTSYRHRTSIADFLNKSPWDETFLLHAIREHAIKRIWQIAKATKQPIYVIIDDTICEKTMPSSKVQNTIQGCFFHKSHLKGKMVYGHQFVTVMLRCNNVVVLFDIVLYNKDKMSKNEIAQSIIKDLPKPVDKGYVLGDSWYTCKKLFEVAHNQRYSYLGAFKSNRIIYPRGHRKKGIQIGAFAKTLKMHEFNLVTVGGKTYYTYTYLGKINSAKKAKIVISWPKDALYNEKAMKTYISLDIKMSEKQLLNYYIKRWPVETFFRESKSYLGFDQYQIRSTKGIKRYMALVVLTYIYCELEIKGTTLGFSQGLKKVRSEVEECKIRWVYEKAQADVPLSDILKTLKIA